MPAHGFVAARAVQDPGCERGLRDGVVQAVGDAADPDQPNISL